MSRNIYLFNPENDLALANGNENFEAPLSARTMGFDLSLLPLWYAEENAAVLTSWKSTEGISSEIRQLLKPGINIIPYDSYREEMRPEDIFCPWGWSPATAKFLNKISDKSSCLLAPNLKKCRELSHRRFVIDVLQELRHQSLLDDTIILPEQLFTIHDIKNFVNDNFPVILKAPWSGSGKGLLWNYKPWGEKAEQWSSHFLKKQGSVIGEHIRQKKEDFAMQFYSDGKQTVTFSGYSDFTTDLYGVYRSNRLASDDAIENKISSYVSSAYLEKLKAVLAAIFSLRIAPYYTGYFGVDMMVCKHKHEARYFIYPCVEVNLRMNMGMISRLIYNEYIEPASTGNFFVDYHADSAALAQDHSKRIEQYPLQIKNGKIAQGYVSLCPITKNTHYRAWIQIQKK
jgi:hypothetical protein